MSSCRNEKFLTKMFRCERRAFARAALTASSKHWMASLRYVAQFATYVFPLRKDFANAAIFSICNYCMVLKSRYTPSILTNYKLRGAPLTIPNGGIIDTLYLRNFLYGKKVVHPMYAQLFYALIF